MGAFVQKKALSSHLSVNREQKSQGHCSASVGRPVVLQSSPTGQNDQSSLISAEKTCQHWVLKQAVLFESVA